MNNDCTDKYKDIINLPHHQSKRRPRRSMIDRAAQFSPFAALTGHNDAIIETARLTDRKIELDEGTKSVLNEKIQMISDYLSEMPTVTFTHFEPDIKKDGGAYLKTTGTVKKIDDFNKEIYLTDGTIILIEHIYEIESELFKFTE
ncbi:MAG: hypothetical protein U0L48_02725 [Acutalibacteraceae bacterium]|nr:hypothetical protein [Acutalibacteraceae bacterium]